MASSKTNGFGKTFNFEVHRLYVVVSIVSHMFLPIFEDYCLVDQHFQREYSSAQCRSLQRERKNLGASRGGYGPVGVA